MWMDWYPLHKSSWVVSSGMFCQLPPNTWNLRRSTLMKSRPNINTFKPHRRTTMTGPATKCHLSELATTYVKLTKDDNWKPAQIIAQSSTPRSFSVQTEGGQIYRRNRRHLRHSAQPGQYTQTPSESPGPSGHLLNAAQLPPGQLAPDATNYLPGCHAHPTAAQHPPGQPATCNWCNQLSNMCNQVWKTSEATPGT